RDAEARVGPSDAERERRSLGEVVAATEEDDRLDRDVARSRGARHGAAETVEATVVVAEVLVDDRQTRLTEHAPVRGEEEVPLHGDRDPERIEVVTIGRV